MDGARGGGRVGGASGVGGRVELVGWGWCTQLCIDEVMWMRCCDGCEEILVWILVTFCVEDAMRKSDGVYQAVYMHKSVNSEVMVLAGDGTNR